ncbi:MAG: MotA/TolQ/ExbB proton channel family protein [bacterium]|nr:MotA/TolQ/ExbB proton channel family protein [bacterium]
MKKQGAFVLIAALVCVVVGIGIFFVLPKFIQDGGPVVAILLALNLMIWVFVVERLLTLSKAKGARMLPLFFNEFLKAVREGKYTQAVELCEKQKGSAASVLRAGMEQWVRIEKDNSVQGEKKLTETQRAMDEARLLEVPFLERNLIGMSTIASTATMFGLLGTVIGMIRSFHAMARAGAPDASQLALGISEALINTALGIFGGIVGIFTYNIFTTRVDNFNYSIDEAVYMTLELLKEKI